MVLEYPDYNLDRTGNRRYRKMERYDFRINAEIAGEVGAEIDKLETRQLVTIHKAIQDTKDLTEEERKQLYETWFRNAILPALKEFSELT